MRVPCFSFLSMVVSPFVSGASLGERTCCYVSTFADLLHRFRSVLRLRYTSRYRGMAVATAAHAPPTACDVKDVKKEYRTDRIAVTWEPAYYLDRRRERALAGWAGAGAPRVPPDAA